MKTSVVYSKLALGDLESIWGFYDNSYVSKRIVDDILNKVERLAILPESGTPLDSRCVVHSDYRFVLSGHYLVFYLYKNASVQIVRILDSRSDYLRKLFGSSGPGIDLYL